MNPDTFDHEERDYKEKCRNEVDLQSYLRIDPPRPGTSRILQCREFIARLPDLTKKNNCSDYVWMQAQDLRAISFAVYTTINT